VSDFEKTILAAQGYFELNMLQDAIVELNTLPLTAQLRPDVMEMRVLTLMKAGQWREAFDACEKLCAVTPDSPVGFIHAAFCLHELGRTREAKEVLLDGPASLIKDPTYHYNLACYECALGNLDIARAYLEKSLSMDRKLRDYAKSDPDLKALHP
jgi:predicted Zn-dependent protease